MSETLQNVFLRKKVDPTRETHNPTLYEKLGGAPAVSTAVDVFYRKVIRDARINYFFFGVNVTEQAEKQKSFLTMAFGGPHQYTGRDMKKSHAKLIALGMRDRHFDIVMDHLRDTLVEVGVEQALVDEVLAIAESTREDVMGRSVSPPEAGTPGRVRPAAPAPALPAKGTVGAIVSGRLVTLNADLLVEEAIEIFVSGNHDSLPVVDAKGTLIGVVTAKDLLKSRPR